MLALLIAMGDPRLMLVVLSELNRICCFVSRLKKLDANSEYSQHRLIVFGSKPIARFPQSLVEAAGFLEPELAGSV